MRKLVRNRILKKYNYQCVYCGAKDRLEIDHIIPLSGGGRHDEDNMQVLCISCNRKKGRNLDLTYFDKYFKKGDGNNYMLVSTNLPIKQMGENLTKIIDRQFEIYCKENL